MPARNISEYPQLLNAIHSAEKIVYLCGAGASMSLGSHRLSWTNWIAEGRKYLTIPEQNELNLKGALQSLACRRSDCNNKLRYADRRNIKC